MKKRFTLMMMVLCFLMSIPLKMMAYDEVKVVSQYKVDKWSENTNFKFTTTDGKIYTCTLNDVPAGTQYIWFRLKIGTTEYGPQQDATKDLTLTSSDQKIYQISWEAPKALMIDNTSGKTSYTITYDRVNNNIKCDASEGGSTGGGPEGGSGTTVNWNTVSENRLTAKPRVYSQGFYLAGNFFTFDKKDEINYYDAVFKFQQQKDQSISAVAETAYDVYMVEIPASLTAKAQVMYVDANGNKTGIFGPGAANKIIDKGTPATGQSTEWSNITANESTNLLDNTQNYWNFSTRNESSSEYSDGLYEVYIAVEKTTHEPAKWMIKHQAKKRVAYFISDAPDATAIPLYDSYISDDQGGRFSNKFFATVNLADSRSYYVISNYVKDSQYAGCADAYNAINPNLHAISCPTTNKLFMLGNAAKDIALTDHKNQFNEFSPNEKPMPGARSGKDQSVVIVEYNPSNGNDTSAQLDKHFGIRGQVIVRSDRLALTSVSLVGDAIPGTLNADKTWNYKSNVADMTFDETEQCYKATVVTTVDDDGQSKFRFVGNRDPKITWYENTNNDVKDMAKHPHDSDDPQVFGHTADANDPNQVNYTEKGENPGEDWNIIWNRPAGRWTVRLYFYTYSDGNDPKTDYYYTITANHDLVLRDFDDVVYKTEGKREILLRGGYKFFRTWSDNKAWKVSDDVDIFIVVDKTPGVDNGEFSLKRISGSETAHVIPANVGVILATKKDATNIKGGGKFYDRPSLTSYNTLVIPMEEYTGEETTADYGDNRLESLIEAQVVPTKEGDKYNYLFGFFRANKGLGVTTYKDNQFLLGFWLSKGSGLFYSNSAYLPVSEATAKKMNLGVSYNDFNVTGAKKVPALLFDFANVGGTTGINEVVNQSTKLNDGKYYTLSGQQVEKPTAGGIYIHNGRKFVVK